MNLIAAPGLRGLGARHGVARFANIADAGEKATSLARQIDVSRSGLSTAPGGLKAAFSGIAHNGCAGHGEHDALPAMPSPSAADGRATLLTTHA